MRPGSMQEDWRNPPYRALRRFHNQRAVCHGPHYRSGHTAQDPVSAVSGIMPGHERFGFERAALTLASPREFMHVRSGETAISSWLAQSRLLVVGLILLLVLAACGGGDGDGDKKDNTPTAAPQTQASPIAQRETCMAAVTTSTGSPTAGVVSPSLLE